MFRKSITALTFLVILTTSVFAQKVPRSYLTKDSVLIGDQVAWITDFTFPEGVDLKAVPYKQTLAADTTLRGAAIEVVKDLQIDSVSLKNGQRELRAKLMLSAFDSGSFHLPAPVILYSIEGRADTLSIDPQDLYVNTVQIDTASFKPYDIKAQEKYPITIGEVLPWVLLALAVALIIWAICRYISMKRKNKNFFGKSVQVEPPHITALKKLEKLRLEKVWKVGKEKQYYTGITDALRNYIESRYGFGAMEKTSTEIMESLKDKKLDEKIFNDLDEMFARADLVKFAKYTPSETDNENAIPVAVNFVNFAYMQQLEEAKKEEVK